MFLVYLNRFHVEESHIEHRITDKSSNVITQEVKIQANNTKKKI